MKKRGLMVLGVCCLAFLSGCAHKVSAPALSENAEVMEADVAIELETKPLVIETEQTEPETAAAEDYPEERIEVDGLIRSYLTGEMIPVEQGNRRPLAIMMSNDKGALPQYGINRAGVVYEAPVEGAMNRYMAILEAYDDLERIGSVRSCRTYYTYFAREFDAVYAHYGQSTFALPYLKNVDNINGVEGIGTVAYYRAKDKKAPHNAYASGSSIKKAMEKLGYAQEYNSSYQGHFQFSVKNPVVLEGDDAWGARKITLHYPINEPWFEYQEEDGLYYRYQYGAAHLGNEGQIAVKNILIQYCPAGYYATTEYRDINVHGSGWGYYVTGGKAIDVTWKKDGEFGVTHYYDASGKEIRLNPGKTWVCICTTDNMQPATFEGK